MGKSAVEASDGSDTTLDEEALRKVVVDAVVEPLSKLVLLRRKALDAILRDDSAACVEYGAMLGHLSAAHQATLAALLRQSLSFAAWEGDAAKSEWEKAVGRLMRAQMEARARLLVESAGEARSRELEAGAAGEVDTGDELLPPDKDDGDLLHPTFATEEADGRAKLDDIPPPPPEDSDSD